MKLSPRRVATMLAVLLGCAVAPALAQENQDDVLTRFDKNPVPLRTPPPVCPAEMRDTTGIVSIMLVIDEQGNVVDANVVKSTNVAFEEPSLEAVRRWKFKPAEKDGHPVKAKVNLPLHFNS